MNRFHSLALLPVLLLAVTLLLPRCGGIRPGKTPDPVRITDENGVVRHSAIYVPAEFREGLPMLVYFHGVRSEGFRNMAALKGYTGSPVEETGLVPFCNANRVLLLEVLPSYTYRFLDVDARGWSPFGKEAGGVEACIDAAARKYGADPRRIFLSGISAGAAFSHFLAHRRPGKYRGVLSHSQAYISEDSRVLTPSSESPRFNVVLCYTRGDYRNLKDICERSYEEYRKAGYPVTLLRDLPPDSHRWSVSTNGRFWKLLNSLPAGSPPDPASH